MGLDNPLHIAFLLILLLLVFGAKRLPEMGRSLGDGMRGFKDALGGSGGAPAHADADAEPAHAVLVSHAPRPVAPAAVVQGASQPLGEEPAAA
jgi:sec-independent protein translocase protein TatA